MLITRDVQGGVMYVHKPRIKKLDDGSYQCKGGYTYWNTLMPMGLDLSGLGETAEAAYDNLRKITLQFTDIDVIDFVKMWRKS